MGLHMTSSVDVSLFVDILDIVDNIPRQRVNVEHKHVKWASKIPCLRLALCNGIVKSSL